MLRSRMVEACSSRADIANTGAEGPVKATTRTDLINVESRSINCKMIGSSSPFNRAWAVGDSPTIHRVKRSDFKMDRSWKGMLEAKSRSSTMRPSYKFLYSSTSLIPGRFLPCFINSKTHLRK
ncbi:hypothetical protein PMAYCL1PPCAC_10617 [Pristionchus mayeri]|uniref:Uncharacterized protein n=1 Tax=Pristionchus mayeri TaxID=1317129 RepID=A0AAN4ZLF7_9BILA|nr:hypothetical protein PMAYCL1PPCAC_10617 [Pristionchus mayeri]